jgi:predicted phosphodiesterase
MIVGVISDTHGLLRPEAVTAPRGSDRIIHAGDVGAPEVLTALSVLAPVTVVRGGARVRDGFNCRSRSVASPSSTAWPAGRS